MSKNRSVHDPPRQVEERWRRLVAVATLSTLLLTGCGVITDSSRARAPRDIGPGIVCGLAMTGGHFVVCSRGRTLFIDR